MDLGIENSVDKKGLWDRAMEAKDAVIDRLKGAEAVALEAIEKTQNEVITEIQASDKSLKATVQVANQLTQQAQENLSKAEDGSARIAELSSAGEKTVELIKAKSEEAKNSQAQIQSLLKTVETSDAEAKAHLKEVVATKADMKNQFTEISTFYSEIGERKNELLDLKKNTATELSKLSENSTTTLEEHKIRTESLISKNESLGKEIESHLQRAVGASLFSAFGTRKDKIVVGKWAWFIALVVSMVVGIYWVDSMIKGLNGGNLNTAFVVRTVFGVLIGYFVYFCSKQYDRERRAEEEYAFKAAVSVSLKPFHDLLIESKNKEIDDEFMKVLMQEIFDNPVNRLFLEGKLVSKLQINGQGVNGEHTVEPASSPKK